jgi:hypothetical protein
MNNVTELVLKSSLEAAKIISIHVVCLKLDIIFSLLPHARRGIGVVSVEIDAIFRVAATL